jgi:2-oxoglutarate dehydrogenase E2 component (dihydrolipoamide succinyltransferase)
MAIELVIPSMGESISEVEIGTWKKAAGDLVQRDEPLVSIESDKATVELPAPESGRLTEIVKQKGARATVGEVIGFLEVAASASASASASVSATTATSAPAVAVSAPSAFKEPPAAVMPAARRVLAQSGIDPSTVRGSGPGGRVLKQDVMDAASPPATVSPAPRPRQPIGERREEAVPMSMIRRRIAERLVQAKQQMAMLTTFNEIDMSTVIALRKQHGQAFFERHGVKLGMMSFFVKAAIEALRDSPALNCEIRGDQIIYRHYYDIGIAVGGGRGLVVPVLQNAEHKSFSQIEQAIADFGKRAKDNTLKVEELQGGTFTITNGGVYGSLLATPIINPPQVAILGMHAIQERPVVRDGQIVARPMMYVALSYDHRIVDGKESIGFLKRIKELVEDPTRALLEV